MQHEVVVILQVAQAGFVDLERAEPGDDRCDPDYVRFPVESGTAYFTLAGVEACGRVLSQAPRDFGVAEFVAFEVRPGDVGVRVADVVEEAEVVVTDVDLRGGVV